MISDILNPSKKGISDELKGIVSKIDVEFINDTNISLKELTDTFNLTDEAALKFIETQRKAGTQFANTDEFVGALNKELSSTPSKFKAADLGAKALSASMKVLSTVGWMAIAEIVMVAAQIWNYWFEQIIDNL